MRQVKDYLQEIIDQAETWGGSEFAEERARDVLAELDKLENPIPKIPLVFTPESFDDLMERCNTGLPPGLAAMMAINWCHARVEELLQEKD